MGNNQNPAVYIDEVLHHLHDVSIEMMSQEYDFNFMAEKLLLIFEVFRQMPGKDVLVEPGEMEIEMSIDDIPTEIGTGTVTFKLKAEVSFKLDK